MIADDPSPLDLPVLARGRMILRSPRTSDVDERLTIGRHPEFWARFRFVWPSELDLMAHIAGMTLKHRWSDWNRAPFEDDSTSAISVWCH